MASILEHLREEHRQLQVSLSRLREADGGSEQRLYQLRCQYTAYARAEESVFYSYMIHVKGVQERALRGIEEHLRLDTLLRHAERMSRDDPGRDATITALCETMSQHLREEEQQLFALARGALGEREAAGLGACFVAERARLGRDLGRLEASGGGEPPGPHAADDHDSIVGSKGATVMNKQQIYEILKREHEEVGELFHQLDAAKGTAAQQLLGQIKLKLVPHSRGEEAVVYPRLLKEKAAAEKVRESLEEHRQVDVLLEELAAMTPRDPNWLAKARVLADMVGHHVDEEEGELFPLARQILSDREATRLAEEYAEERDRVMQTLMREEQRGAAE